MALQHKQINLHLQGGPTNHRVIGGIGGFGGFGFLCFLSLGFVLVIGDWQLLISFCAEYLTWHCNANK